MIFSLLMLALVGVVAFFHYTQGFFSATISAVLVVLCAVMAVAYNEAIVAAVFKGNLGDYANAFALIGVFALSYFVLRMIFDKAIPGNVRTPLIADKVGAGAMGLVAGLFTAGVVALAAQMLPFGPSIGGYSRWELNGERDVQVPTSGQTQDAFVYGDLKADRIDHNNEHGLILPVDDLLVGTVAKLSDNGSLAGDVPLQSVHPDLVGELNASRLGIQVGAKHTAYQSDKGNAFSVEGVFCPTVPALPQWDAELPGVRGARDNPVPTSLKPDAGQVILVIPVKFSNSLSDSDGKVRFSPAAVRLKAGKSQDMDFHPIGTLQAGPIVFNDKDDDPLIADVGKNVYLVFVVPGDEVLQNYDPKSKDWKMVSGSFLEFKRDARQDLSGQEVTFATPAATDTGLLRKPFVVKAAMSKLGAGLAAESQGEAAEQQPKQAPKKRGGVIGKSGGSSDVPGVGDTVEGITGGVR